MRAVAPQRNLISRCPGLAQQCTNLCVHTCRKNLPSGRSGSLYEDYSVVLWCNSLLKCSDEQTKLAVGEAFVVLQCAVDLTTMFALWLNQAAHPLFDTPTSNVSSCTCATQNWCRAASVSEWTDQLWLRPIFKALLQTVSRGHLKGIKCIVFNGFNVNPGCCTGMFLANERMLGFNVQ